MDKTSALRCQTIAENFLAIMEWEEEVEVDEAARCVKLQTSLNIGDQSARLFLEAGEDTDYVDVFIYYYFKCKPAKLTEMAVLMNGIH